MEFRIQASNPRFTNHFDKEDVNVEEAVQTVFPLYTEYAFMIWHHIPVALSYKYDISMMINDIKLMLSDILRTEQGNHKVIWTSDTFWVDWLVEWNTDKLIVESNWGTVIGDLEANLRDSGKLVTTKADFVAEWKELLHRVLDALYSSGYSPDSLEGMTELEQIYESIPMAGILYRNNEVP